MSTEQTPQTHSPTAVAAKDLAPPPVPKRYFVKFEGNQSKRWDGKQVELDGGWLESLYSQEELAPGKQLTLPWPGKGKNVTNWNVVVLGKPMKEVKKAADTGTKKKKLSKCTSKKGPEKKDKQGRIIRVGSKKRCTVAETGTSPPNTVTATSGQVLASSDTCITQLVQQQEKIVSLLSTLVEQHSHPPPPQLVTQNASLSLQRPVISSQSGPQPHIMSPQSPQSASLPPQQLVVYPQNSSLGPQPPIMSPQSPQSASLPPQQPVVYPQNSSLGPQPPIMSPQRATIPLQQAVNSPHSAPHSLNPPVITPQSPQSVSLPPQQPVMYPHNNQSSSLGPQTPIMSPQNSHSSSLPPVPQQQSFFPQHQFLQPSMPPSSRRQDDISIDELLSDDYSWNDSDSDYLTSSTFSEQEASGGTSGNASGNVSSSFAQGIPRPPFATPPKLQPIEQVMRNNPGSNVASLRSLTTALARDAIFGREELARSSLSGRKNTGTLSDAKLTYIKTLVQSRVPNKSPVEFEHIWSLCRQSLSKSCQTLRTSAKRKI